MAEHRIMIQHEPFGAGYEMKVESPVPRANFDVERPTHRDALRYARSLKVVHGWRIDNRRAEMAS
jgi:hypothetical protein